VGVDLDQGLDGDEGKYWLERRPSRGGSRLALNVGGVDRMGRNPSSTHLLHNLSKDNLTQRNKSKASLYHVEKSGSRPNLTNPSKWDLFAMNGHPAGNASQYELPTGTKSRHQSRLDLGKALNENQSIQEPLRGGYVVVPDPQKIGHHGNMVPEKKKHGPLCRLRQFFSPRKPRK